MTRILVVRLGSLGDIVHAIPAVAAIRRQWPSARLDWAVAPEYRDLAGMVRGVDHVVPIDTRALLGPAGILTAIRALRAVGYDAVIDLQGLLKSAVLARLAGGRRTLGFDRRDLREPVAARFYTSTVDVSRAAHVIDKGLALLGGLGCVTSAREFPLEVPDVPEVRALVARTSPAGYALLNPGAAWPNKRWPVERFGAVAARLHADRGLRGVVMWGPGERPRAEAVVAASGGTAEVAPPTTFPVMAALGRHACLVVSGDTGPLHLAAAAGAPVVALFGPTRAERNGPWAEGDLSISRVDRCECVYERQCRRPEPCIDTIGVDEVVAAAMARLDQADSRGPA
ncbi:MAG: lipopolysaccharide heptosyltransferase I [Vicinamibacterales bacterium]|nr:lipopolysaccharide heptosyltransferase I [Vicinamibacterales bacterium]